MYKKYIKALFLNIIYYLHFFGDPFRAVPSITILVKTNKVMTFKCIFLKIQWLYIGIMKAHSFFFKSTKIIKMSGRHNVVHTPVALTPTVVIPPHAFQHIATQMGTQFLLLTKISTSKVIKIK